MDRTLTWTTEAAAGAPRISLNGELTENSQLGALLETLSGKVVFDLAGIQRINSPGVREWINFVNAADAKGVAFTFERCSVPFVNQLNMISNFRGKGTVLSVFAPYFCSSCTRDEKRLLDLAKDVTAQLEDPFKCPNCGSQMEFDDVPDAFLAFRS